MRRLFFFPFLFIFGFSQAQHGIKFGFSDTHIGDNLTLTYTHSINSIQFELGLKYHYFNLIHDNQSMVIKDRVYPYTFLKHFGPVGGIRKSFPIANTTFAPELYFQAQYIYGGLRNSYWSPYAISPDGRKLYTKEVVVFQEQHNLENILGIGFEVELIPRLNYYTRAGLILGVFWGMDPRLINVAPSAIEFGFMYAVGIQFEI